MSYSRLVVIALSLHYLLGLGDCHYYYAVACCLTLSAILLILIASSLWTCCDSFNTWLRHFVQLQNYHLVVFLVNLMMNPPVAVALVPVTLFPWFWQSPIFEMYLLLCYLETFDALTLAFFAYYMYLRVRYSSAYLPIRQAHQVVADYRDQIMQGMRSFLTYPRFHH